MEQTLKHWRSTPFIWGKSDCLLSIADYIVENGGVDGGKGLRGTYDTEQGANAHVRAAGGFEALINATGIAETDNPSEGDVCVCRVMNQPTAGLHTSDGVVFRHKDKGVVEISDRFLEVVQSWSIKSCRP